jgi:hypothetical protein
MCSPNAYQRKSAFKITVFSTLSFLAELQLTLHGYSTHNSTSCIIMPVHNKTQKVYSFEYRKFQRCSLSHIGGNDVSRANKGITCNNGIGRNKGIHGTAVSVTQGHHCNKVRTCSTCCKDDIRTQSCSHKT